MPVKIAAVDVEEEKIAGPQIVIVELAPPRPDKISIFTFPLLSETSKNSSAVGRVELADSSHESLIAFEKLNGKIFFNPSALEENALLA
jgi:hypothetical protein